MAELIELSHERGLAYQRQVVIWEAARQQLQAALTQVRGELAACRDELERAREALQRAEKRHAEELRAAEDEVCVHLQALDGVRRAARQAADNARAQLLRAEASERRAMVRAQHAEARVEERVEVVSTTPRTSPTPRSPDPSQDVSVASAGTSEAAGDGAVAEGGWDGGWDSGGGGRGGSVPDVPPTSPTTSDGGDHYSALRDTPEGDDRSEASVLREPPPLRSVGCGTSEDVPCPDVASVASVASVGCETDPFLGTRTTGCGATPGDAVACHTPTPSTATNGTQTSPRDADRSGSDVVALRRRISELERLLAASQGEVQQLQASLQTSAAQWEKRLAALTTEREAALTRAQQLQEQLQSQQHQHDRAAAVEADQEMRRVAEAARWAAEEVHLRGLASAAQQQLAQADAELRGLRTDAAGWKERIARLEEQCQEGRQAVVQRNRLAAVVEARTKEVDTLRQQATQARDRLRDMTERLQPLLGDLEGCKQEARRTVAGEIDVLHVRFVVVMAGVVGCGAGTCVHRLPECVTRVLSPRVLCCVVLCCVACVLPVLLPSPPSRR